MAKKKRTSIRTAAGTTQEKFLARIREVAANPLQVLPECPHGEPGQITKIRRGIEKVVAGKSGLLVRRDRGIVGAIWQTTQLTELTAVPRLVDHKVGGRRRFFLTRGQVNRVCMLGVQNAHDPQVLLMAYRDLAKQHNLHFFADSKITCSGSRPIPPDSWWEFLGTKAEIEWQDHRCRTCAHPEGDLVEITFPAGPGVAVCANCSKNVGNLHEMLRAQYAGPAQRKPFHVHILRGGVDGERLEVERELLAQYRGGMAGEAAILRDTLARWRETTDGYIMAGAKFDDQDAFLNALKVPAELRDAVRVMTAGGHTGSKANLATVLAEHASRLPAAAETIMSGGAEFVRGHGGEPLQALQACLAESSRRLRTADMPSLSALGPVGTWLDNFARTVRADGPAEGIQTIRRGLSETVPKSHLYAALLGLGGDISLDARFDLADKRAGEEYAAGVAPLLKATGKEYTGALDAYLRESGSGERVTKP